MRYRRSKTHLYIHFVWCTKNRRPVISDEIERSLYRCITEICESLSCTVIAIGGMPDHVHLLTLISPKVSISQLMKNVKGGSSRFVSTELFSNERFDWQDHYGAFSISARDRQKVISYILNQKQHHAEGTIYPRGEETDEESDIEIPQDK